VLIAPSASSADKYVVLVIGPYGTVCVESGESLFDPKMGRLLNEVQMGELIVSRMDVKLAFNQGGVPNPSFVVRDGNASFIDCLFSSGSSSSQYPTHSTVYIADVIENGVMLIKDCAVDNLQVEHSGLFHVFSHGRIDIKL
jgi:hypothetical protein